VGRATGRGIGWGPGRGGLGRAPGPDPVVVPPPLRREGEVGPPQSGPWADAEGRLLPGPESARPPGPPGPKLRVDWPNCKGHGLCHELLPELIQLDEWGYPVVSGPVPERLADAARRAASACPTLALRLVRPH
jgi:ferredoxin